ncbi:MAG: non-ribosomal peptide synthetase [Jatrophihabitans sp.]
MPAEAAQSEKAVTIETGHGRYAEAGGKSAVRVSRLSFAQEQLWFLDQLAPGETTYRVLLVWRLHGRLRVDLLRRCLNLVVARHGSLRVTIRSEEGVPYQVVAPVAEVPLPMTDLRALPEAERELRVQSEIDAQRSEPYDLETGPLCRFQLLQLADEEYVLCQNFHHIITDGWSVAVMNAELSSAYRSLYFDTEPVFEDLPLEYIEFAESQRARFQGEVLAEELSFWQQRLADLPVLELPADRPRPIGGSHQGQTLIKDFPDDLRGIVQQLAEDHGASMFMVVAAACNLVLSRYTGLADVPTGIPMLGRPEPELEALVGMFINMVVLRTDLSDDPSFSDLIDRIADGTMELYEHQEVSFNQVVDAVQPVRDPDRNPLFQVSLQLLGESTSGEHLSFPEVVGEFVPLASNSSRFDIGVNIIDTGSSLRAVVEYSSELFDSWRMEAMLTHLDTALRGAAADPGRRLSQIPIVTGAEAEQLLSIGRGEVVEYSRQPLHVAVAEVARQQPDAAAVVCGGVELSYRELDRRADLLARHLRARGLRPGQVVAVAIDRGLDAYVIMLGVLKAGGTYTMLDPACPANRLAFMIADTLAPLVITRSGMVDLLPESTGWQTMLIDADWPAVEAIEVDEPLVDWASIDTLACIVYTADPVGQPNGVMITHRALSSACEAYRRSFDIGSDDRVLQLPSLSFDLSQGELWTSLLNGATVVAVPPEDAPPERLAALVRDQRVSHACLPAAVHSLIDASLCPDLKYLICGGEVLSPELIDKLHAGARRLVNLYGPVEAVIACIENDCISAEQQDRPPIGRPQVNRQVYVVDPTMNLVPRGVAGELLIGGEPGGLATGYLNQPERTAERFVDDPFRPGRLVFRSGDLVRWNSDLQLEFLGRVDNPITVGGLRVELGAVEAALISHPDVGGAVVVARPNEDGEERLIGYLTPATDRTQVPVPEELRAHLAGRLAGYLIPTAWVVLAEFPLIAGWKIDRDALPDPAGAEAEAEAEADEIGTSTEQSIAGIFGEVLSLSSVGLEDSFFEIGGNSLQAMRAVSRINKGFGIKLSVRTLYGNVTVRAVSAAVEEKLDSKPA